MKTLRILFAAVALFAVAITVKAQSPTFFNNIVWTGGRFATGTSNLAAPVFMDVRKQQNVGLAARIQGTTAITNFYIFGFSDDGTTYSTNAPDIIIWNTDSISTFATTRTTNIACGGHGYLVLFQVNNTLINTNSLSYTTKISAP